MKDNIFSDLYDKVLSFFTVQSEKDESKLLAKSRLKSVLMQDRVGFSERAMQMLKDDMLESISRYLEIDVNSFDLSLDATDDTTILNLSIPVLRPKTDDEIDEILSIEQKAKIEKTQEIVGEIQELVKEKVKVLAEMSEEDEDSKDSENDENSSDDKEDSKSEDEKEDPQDMPESENEDIDSSNQSEEKPVRKKSKKKS